METQSETTQSLIELLIDADKEALLEKHADLLTPDQLWRACEELIDYEFKYAAKRTDVFDYLVENHPDEFITEYAGKWTPELVAKMVEKVPEDCLEFLKAELSLEQRLICMEANPIAGACNFPDELPNHLMEAVIKNAPEQAILFLHKRLDDKTFHKLVNEFPQTGFYVDPERLSQEFLKKYLVEPNKYQDRALTVWGLKLSDAQLQAIIDKHPQFAIGKLQHWVGARRPNLRWPDGKKSCANKPCPFMKAGILIIGILIGIIATTLILS